MRRLWFYVMCFGQWHVGEREWRLFQLHHKRHILPFHNSSCEFNLSIFDHLDRICYQFFFPLRITGSGQSISTSSYYVRDIKLVFNWLGGHQATNHVRFNLFGAPNTNTNTKGSAIPCPFYAISLYPYVSRLKGLLTILSIHQNIWMSLPSPMILKRRIILYSKLILKHLLLW